MDLIEFAEKQGEEAAKFSLATLEQARSRCHQLLVLLLGGGGALAGVGLAQIAQHHWVASGALTVAMWWFCAAAWVALRGLRSRPITAWAHEGTAIVSLHAQWMKYHQECLDAGQSGVHVMDEVRLSTLRSMKASADGYRAASAYAVQALDQAYIFTACTPLPLAGVAVLAAYFG